MVVCLVNMRRKQRKRIGVGYLFSAGQTYGNSFTCYRLSLAMHVLLVWISNETGRVVVMRGISRRTFYHLTQSYSIPMR